MVAKIQKVPTINSGMYADTFVIFYFKENRFAVEENGSEFPIPEVFAKALWKQLWEEAKEISHEGEYKPSLQRLEDRTIIGVRGLRGLMCCEMPR